jgi:hypothetical protein
MKSVNNVNMFDFFEIKIVESKQDIDDCDTNEK